MNVHRFKKAQRLTRRSDFDRVLSSGRRIHTRRFVIVLCPNQLSIKRLGLIASKKIGNAVRRNRTKRLLREVFRLNNERFPASMDVVIIAKPGAPDMDYWGVSHEIVARLP